METHHDKVLDSPSKNSYIGSYYQPPDRIPSVSRQLKLPAPSSVSIDHTASPLSQTTRNIDSKAVVDALKTLQEKIRRLELERTETEKSYIQYSHDSQKRQQVTASFSQTAANLPGPESSVRKELDLKLQSAEARCGVLEKQLDYMRKMVENAKKERNVLMENQASLQGQQTSSSSNRTQQEKLEKLESECQKLNRTQTAAEMKLAILEHRLLREEHERKLVQEKADELQREIDVNLRLSVPAAEETKPNKKTRNKTGKAFKKTELASGSPTHKKMPFVAGTSISPSHSVHANLQSILHMMKHHQPKLCEQVSALHRSGCGARKSLQRDFSTSAAVSLKPDSLSVSPSLGSLSDILLALQDELGQMSFEHQELEQQIDAAQYGGHREDLKRDLERLVIRMEEKSAQISKLRKHQDAVHRLKQSQSHDEDHTARPLNWIRPPAPSPVKAKQKAKKGMMSQKNLQLLKESQKFRKSLQQNDLFWET
ncbi:centrosomal protein CEP57L1 isoform 2-T2 [Menidia menidia]